MYKIANMWEKKINTTKKVCVNRNEVCGLGGRSLVVIRE